MSDVDEVVVRSACAWLQNTRWSDPVRGDGKDNHNAASSLMRQRMLEVRCLNDDGGGGGDEDDENSVEREDGSSP